MKKMKMSFTVLAILSLNAAAEPSVVAPQMKKVVEVDKKEFTIQDTTTKMIVILESAFGAMASVKDKETLAAAGVKLDKLAKETLSLEAQLDATVKPDDKQMKMAAVGFVLMADKVGKQMEVMEKLNLSDELKQARELQFMQFLKKINSVKLKMDILFPPEKLTQFSKEIRAENAEVADKKNLETRNPAE